jgi:glycosyltransferase involved in cell wall biosynthesis
VRCLHIIAGDLWAGAEVSAFNLMLELACRPGIDLEAALFRDGELASRLRRAGIPVHVFPDDRGSFPTLIRQAVAGLAARPPELVHSHKTREHLVGAALAARYGARHVRSVHGMPPRLALNGSLLGLADLFADALADLSESTWIAVSRELAGQIAGMRRSVRVVPNGLPDTIPERDRDNLDAWLPSDAHHRYIGFVGRLERVKRPDRFVQLLARLRSVPECSDVRGVILGDGSLRGQVAAQIERLGVSDFVKMLGHRDDADRLLPALDALVICSDHEGHPMVLLEAMRAGVPVISFDMGGLREVLGETPWLVPAGDEPAMARAAARLLSDASASRAWSARLRGLFLERYTIGRTADQVISIYAQC